MINTTKNISQNEALSFLRCYTPFAESPYHYWHDEDCILFNGKSEEVLPLIESESIDLTVTSPPYDNLRTYNGFSWDFEAIAKELFRITKPGGVCVWVVGDATIDGSETLTSAKQKIFFREGCGWNIHDTMIWARPGFSAVGSLSVRYAPVFEYMIVLSKGLPKTFNPIKDRTNINGGKIITGTNRQKDGTFRRMSSYGKTVNEYGQRYNIWEINPQTTHNDHMAVFPEQLAEDHIKSWSNPGDTVLDCFAGSGTTQKAAKLLKRNSIGIEISKEYCELIKRRLNPPMPLFEQTANGV